MGGGGEYNDVSLFKRPGCGRSDNGISRKEDNIMVNGLKPKGIPFPEKTVGNDVINKSKSAQKKTKKRSPGMLAAIVLTFLLIVLMITLALFTSVDEVTNVFDAGRVDIILTESKWKPADAKYVVPEQELPKNPKVTNNEKTDVYVFLEVTVPYLSASTEIENSTHNDASQGKALTTPTQINPIPLYKFGTANVNNNADPATVTYNYNTSLDITQSKINTGWTLVNPSSGDAKYPKVDAANKTITYVYAHTDNSSGTDKLIALKPGYTTQTALFDSVKVINFDENAKINDETLTDANSLQGKLKSISVKAYGIQSNYLGVNSNDLYGVWNIIKLATP